MNCNIKLIIKIAVSLLVFLVVSYTMKYYQPAVGGSIAVNQLEDSYSSSASVKIWQDFKNNWIFCYGVLVIALFFTDIRKLFKKDY